MLRHSFLLIATLCAAPLLACSALTGPDPLRDGGGSGSDMGGGGTDAGSGHDLGPGHDGGPGVDGGPPSCPASCDDGVMCTTDSCDTATGMCRHVANDAACTGGQHCSPSMGCVSGSCTSDAACSDGNACNGTETCHPGATGATALGCVAGAALDCNDHADCTADSCNMATGCVHTPNAAACDDAIACTADACSPGASGSASGCTHTPNDAMCTGTGACTTGGTCDPTFGCTGGTPVMCMADGNPCTADPPCDPTMGGCVHPPHDTDGDGFTLAFAGGMACPGGTDCNDTNAAVHPGATEVCNGIDDNCNGMVDEGGVCSTTPPNDTCAGATPISLIGSGTTGGLAGTASGSTTAATDDYRSMCSAGTSGPDVVYSVAIPPSSGGGWDVTVTTMPPPGVTSYDTVLAISPTPCGTWNICNDDAMGAPSGSRWSTVTFCSRGDVTDYILVDGYSATDSGSFRVSITVTPHPSGVPCG